MRSAPSKRHRDEPVRPRFLRTAPAAPALAAPATLSRPPPPSRTSRLPGRVRPGASHPGPATLTGSATGTAVSRNTRWPRRAASADTSIRHSRSAPATGPQYHSAPAGCASGPPAPLEGRTGRARGPSPDAGLGELFGLRARVDPIWTLSGDPETSAHIDKCLGIQCFRGGAEGQNRTADTMIFSHVLYRLSYLGTSKNTRCAFRPTTAQSAGAECVAQRRYQHIPQRNCGATGARVGPRGRAVHR